MSKNEKTIIETKSGKIEGAGQKGLYIFKGIPYAVPPVGGLRWLPPQPVKPWKGVRPALTFGPIGPQNKARLVFVKEFLVDEPQSEDCLYLNVWTPDIDDAHRPVMVWIHGGRFEMGSGSNPQHNGSMLAKNGDAVVVTINYRLGGLGFLRLKELTNGAIPATGNEGLFDQIAALQWVHDNIAAFGGNPDNVTIFGESAGAMSVGCLLAMRQARGLFHKAIMQSGASTARPLDLGIQVAGQFLNILGVSPDNTSVLRSLTAKRMLAAQQELASWIPTTNIRGAPLGAVIDGETLPEMPLDAVKHGSSPNIPVLAGSTLEEWNLMENREPRLTNLDDAGLLKRWQRFLPADRVAPLIEAYRSARSKRHVGISPKEISMAIQGDLQFRIPGIRMVEAQQSHNIPAYSYLFDFQSPIPGLGACHTLDVGFVFGTLSESFCGSGPAVDKLLRHIQDAWASFARSGNPSCKSLGNWPPYGNQRETMILGADCHVEAAPYEDERRAIEPIPNSLLG